MKLNFSFINKKELPLIIISQLVIIIYYLPYFILGENVSILIHDNLDSNVTWIKILFINNAAFSSPTTIIHQIQNGIPLSSIYPTYDISLLVFKIFGIFYGYVINRLLISLIGFWGMYFLLKRHFLNSCNPYNSHISVGTSLIFALLPFWSFGAHVLGLPFLFFAFLNLRSNNKKIYNYVIIILFAFYSSLILTGFFSLIILSLVFIYDLIKIKKINWAFLGGLALLSLNYIISHAPLFYTFLFDNFESHRVEIYKETIGLKSAFSEAINIFLNGHYHAHSLHFLFVLPVSIILIFGHKSFSKTIKLIFTFIILTSLFYGIQNSYLLKPLIERITSIIPLQLQRFHFLHPLFWYILFAVVLSWFSERIKYSKIVISSILLIQFAYVLRFHEARANKNKPSFKNFYAEETFNRIKKIIDKPLDSYRVISIGMHPAVAQYNGFYTLDGYISSYPLNYKHEFRKIIESELNRDESLKKYFDNWGSRCYAFSSEFGRNFESNNSDSIQYLKYNFQQLKKMGGEYIISSTAINDSLNKDLILVENINLPNSYWNIYLYKVK
jgi:hypothetical protein